MDLIIVDDEDGLTFGNPMQFEMDMDDITPENPWNSFASDNLDAVTLERRSSSRTALNESEDSDSSDDGILDSESVDRHWQNHWMSSVVSRSTATGHIPTDHSIYIPRNLETDELSPVMEATSSVERREAETESEFETEEESEESGVGSDYNLYSLFGGFQVTDEDSYDSDDETLTYDLFKC